VGSLAYSTGGGFTSFCSGTLVRTKWAVSAAHCAEAALDAMDRGYEVVFVVGTSVQSYGIDDYAIVERAIPSPDYTRSPTYGDIAVLELADDGLPYTPRMALNTNFYQPSWDASLITYVGFGSTASEGTPSGIKRTTDIPIEGILSDLLVTWDPDGRTNVCYGDSGGAALRLDDETGELELVGANAVVFNLDGTEPDCEGPYAAAGTTRIDHHYDWIRSYIGPPDEPLPEPVDDGSDDVAEDTAVDEDPTPIPISDDQKSVADQPKASGCATAGGVAVGWMWFVGLMGLRSRRG